MPARGSDNRHGKFFWPTWLHAAYSDALLEPRLLQDGAAPVAWLPLARSEPDNPAPVRARFEALGAPWQPLLGTHGLRCVVNMREVVRTALQGDPVPREWALDALCASASYLAAQDRVLAALLNRRSAEAQPAGPMEVRLLELHLERLLQSPGARLVRWASAIQRAVRPLASALDAREAPSECVLFSPGRLFSATNRLACKLPSYPKARQIRGDSPLDREAAWLLSCDSVRDGARRDGGVILVNLPAYLSVARMLGRRLLGEERFALPEAGAPKEAWLAAGVAWADAVAEETQGRWLSRHNPHLRASAMGWVVDPSVPLLALNAEAVELEIGGRQAPLPDVAVQTPSSRGFRAQVSVEYCDQKLLVTRRRIPQYDEVRIYFELPFEAPQGYEPRKHDCVVVGGRILWALRAIDTFAKAGGAATAFLEFARRKELELSGDNFQAAVDAQKMAARVAAHGRGETKYLGRFGPTELAAVREALDRRPPGVIASSFWAELAATLPGRTEAAVKRTACTLMLAEVRRLGWPTFRQSSWWPGGNMARSIFARAGQLKAKR